ncbi:MAG: indole-3-glycerol-phosphate synthase [Candidatus Bathyarchaeia archaeon]
MVDFLDVLARDAQRNVRSGYYEYFIERPTCRCCSLKESISKCEHAPIIAEIKPSSPSHGNLREIDSLGSVVGAMERGGAIGISILTEPKHFGGSMERLREARGYTSLPVLMKDVIVDSIQIEAAHRSGADALLLISSIFERGYANSPLEDMIELAHSKGMEVLIEVHTRDEFLSAIETEADLVGINNRDLRTLKVDLRTTERILSSIDLDRLGKVIVSESGIRGPRDIRFLHSCGAKAFLVGSALMLAENIGEKVKELVSAL